MYSRIGARTAPAPLSMVRLDLGTGDSASSTSRMGRSQWPPMTAGFISFTTVRSTTIQY